MSEMHDEREHKELTINPNGEEQGDYDNQNPPCKVKPIGLVIRVVALVLCLAALVVSVKIAYEKGSLDGLEEGYESGFWNGTQAALAYSILLLDDGVSYEVKEEFSNKFGDLLINPSDGGVTEFIEDVMETLSDSTLPYLDVISPYI